MTREDFIWNQPFLWNIDECISRKDVLNSALTIYQDKLNAYKESLLSFYLNINVHDKKYGGECIDTTDSKTVRQALATNIGECIIMIEIIVKQIEEIEIAIRNYRDE